MNPHSCEETTPVAISDFKFELSTDSSRGPRGSSACPLKLTAAYSVRKHPGLQTRALPGVSFGEDDNIIMQSGLRGNGLMARLGLSAIGAPVRNVGAEPPEPVAPRPWDGWHTDITSAVSLGLGHIIASYIRRCTGYVSGSGVKWTSGGAERQCDRALGEPAPDRGAARGGGAARITSHCHFAVRLDHFIPDLRSYSAAVSSKVTIGFIHSSVYTQVPPREIGQTAWRDLAAGGGVILRCT